jgi:hypothetical protein
MSTYKLPPLASEYLKHLISKSPEDLPSLKKIAGIGRVIYSDKESMSAAVANTRPYSLIFGRKFMEDNMRDDYDAVFILFHELTHLVLDHFAQDVLGLFEEKGLSGDKLKTIFAQHCTHIVVDAQVNATCYHTLRDEKYNNFPISFYSFEKVLARHAEASAKAIAAGQEPPKEPTDNMPYCFLHSNGESECPDDKLKEVHRKLYSVKGISNSELIDALLPWFQKNEESVKNAIQHLIGNHKDLMDGDRTSNPNDLTKEEKEILDAIADAIDQGHKNSKDKSKAKEAAGNKEDQKLDKDLARTKKLDGDKENKEEQNSKDYTLNQNPVKLAVARLKQSLKTNDYIKKVLVKQYKPSPSSKLARAIEAFYPHTPRRSVVPNFHDRRTSSLYSCDILPVFHNVPGKGVKNSIACYIDVSGSQEHVIPKVVAAVLRYKKHVGNEVYCFSNVVLDTHVKKLAKGEIFTTGGTDFDPVAEHILENKFKSIIILTDGCAPLSEENISKLKARNVKITVGWTEKNITRAPLEAVSKDEFWLFDDK